MSESDWNDSQTIFIDDLYVKMQAWVKNRADMGGPCANDRKRTVRLLEQMFSKRQKRESNGMVFIDCLQDFYHAFLGKQDRPVNIDCSPVNASQDEYRLIRGFIDQGCEVHGFSFQPTDPRGRVAGEAVYYLAVKVPN